MEQIAALGRGLPFAVNELARRAANEPRWVHGLDANMIGGIAPATREVLQRVAVVGSSFDTDEFVALSGMREDDAFDLLDDALAARIVEPASVGYRFRHTLVREALLEDVPPHRRRRIHRDAASRLIELHASPARIGHHLLQSGAESEAVPYLLRAAETEAAVGAYRDALALVDTVKPVVSGCAARDGADVARRPAQRHRRSDRGLGVPRGARRRRSSDRRESCAYAWRGRR